MSALRPGLTGSDLRRPPRRPSERICFRPPAVSPDQTFEDHRDQSHVALAAAFKGLTGSDLRRPPRPNRWIETRVIASESHRIRPSKTTATSDAGWLLCCHDVSPDQTFEDHRDRGGLYEHLRAPVSPDQTFEDHRDAVGIAAGHPGQPVSPDQTFEDHRDRRRAALRADNVVSPDQTFEDHRDRKECHGKKKEAVSPDQTFEDHRDGRSGRNRCLRQ